MRRYKYVSKVVKESAFALLLLWGAALAQEGRIAYITSAGQLVTVAADGSDPRTLSEPGGRYQFPTWAPGGERVAAVGIADEPGVFVWQDAAESEPRTLYQSSEQPPFYLYWSPDGTTLGFLANHPSGIGFHLASLDRASDGASPNGGESRLRSTGQPFYWQWRGGDQLFIHADVASEQARLALIRSDGDEAEETVARPGLFQAPAVSQSGRYLAFAERDAAGDSRLVLRDTSAETADKRVPHRGLIAFGFSPTADRLAFISPEGTPLPGFYGPLRVLDADTGELTPVGDARAIVLAFFWSPDGSRIAYLTPVVPRRDTVHQPQHPARLSASTTVQERLLLELSVLEVATGSVHSLLTFDPTPLFAAQFLPFFDQYALSHHLWSPASDALVLPVLRDGVPRVMVVPLDGGEAVVIGDGDTPFWSHP